MVYRIILLFILMHSNAIYSQTILINEYLASNVTDYPEMHDFGDYTDWIELYNSDSIPYSLDDFFITDDLQDPLKWKFPDGNVIDAGEYLVIWADDYNEGPGQVYTRPYFPWDNFTTQHYHTNFKLNKTGEQLGLFMVDSNTVLLDSITFGSQITDVSYGRTIEDNTWSFFREPTPGGPNNTASTDIADFSGLVTASLESGFYSGSITVKLSSGPNVEQIYYTLDGSKPSSETSFYTAPITIESTTVLKARTVNTNKLPGEIMVSTYFIDEQSVLPTISLVAECETLWDEDIGIYMNEYKQREIPVTIQYFTQGRNHGFTASAGVRLGGINIWTKAQKPFTIYTRDRFGQDFINYRLFKNKQIVNFSRIVFRNGGDDWEETLLRDPMTESLVSGMMDCGYMAYTPSALFLNGEYWGIHNIREKFGTHYFIENFNINADNIDQLEYAGTPPSGIQLLVIKGDMNHYNTMINYIVNNDLKNSDVYDQIQQWMNVDSFIDHLVMTLYCANTSWSHNREWWRSREENGKWQWLIVDLDRGFNAKISSINLLDDLMKDYELFQYLLTSQFFQERFVQRAAAHLSNTFDPDRISAIVDSLSSAIELEMPRHIDRWGSEGGVSSMNQWSNELDEIKQFSQNRSTIVQNQFINELDLDGTVQVTVAVEPPGSARISINGVPVIHPDGEGNYFKNKPIFLMAQPLPGYQFLGWVGVSDSSQIEYTCSTDSLFTAVFQSSDEMILPEIITENTLLTNEQPYVTIQDLIIPSGVVLTINEGVEIRMCKQGNILVEGQFIINGSEDKPVQIIPHGSVVDNRWGAICFNSATDTSTISHLRLHGASTGPDPVIQQGAISSIHSHIILNHVEIDDVEFPVYVEGGSIVINNSSITCDFTCDYVNVKGGDVLIENSIFYGSQSQDTDAIDLDNVIDGIIRNNRIYDFAGSNSDGIDIGESSEGILIATNLIYHAKDKGVSIGQGSDVTLDRNLIVGCNNGIAVKDNSEALVLNNTFVNNDTTIACYEKNKEAGGGSAEIVNTILSNSLSLSVYTDELSMISASHTLSDSELLEGEGNLFIDPVFVDQSIYNFELDSNSLCVDAGDPESDPDKDGSPADIGAYYTYDPDDYPFQIPGYLISQLRINELLAINNTTNMDEMNEFDDIIELYNPSDRALNLSGLYLSDDLENLTKWKFTDPTIMISGGGHMLIWCDDDQDQGTLHTNFKLSSNGETLVLTHMDGTTIIDQITFDSQTADLSYGRISDGNNGWAFMVPTPGYANLGLSFLVNNSIPDTYRLHQNYPNLFNLMTTLEYDLPEDAQVSITIYDMNGRIVSNLISSQQSAGYKSIQWNTTNNTGLQVSAGLYFYMIQAGEFRQTKKMVLLK